MKFHLTHIVPNPKLHIAYGYAEIIDTVESGLRGLGHDVTRAINKGSHDARNIVFGASMLGIPVLQSLPADTIIYNLEQMAGLRPEDINERVRYCAGRFAIWDYSAFNLPSWMAIDARTSVAHVPIGYAPILSRIDSSVEQDIDVLFYGGHRGDRLRIFGDLCESMVKTMFVHGLYGAARDALIARSKLIVNINQYPQTHVFEIARVSYLFANRKAVVSDFSDSSKIEDDVRAVARRVPIDRIDAECIRLLDSESERAALEESGFECIRKRDIRAILAAVL